jgi:hypothetical protein
MARGKKAKPNARHYPVVLGSELGSVTENTALRFLQVDQELSKLNRRLYRMGRYYKVKIDYKAQPLEDIEVYALRDDWAVQKAYQMAYKMYLENTADERARLGDGQVARWEDFRVDHGLTGNQLLGVLHDTSMGAALLQDGEFQLANVVDGSNVEKSFSWGAATASKYSMLAEYDLHGNAQSSPSSVPISGPYENINTDVDSNTMDNLQGDGNFPPYNRDSVGAASPFVRIATLGSGANGSQRLSTGFFTAPCGIVVCVGSSTGWDSNALRFEVAKGDYKGVHAPSMLE